MARVEQPLVSVVLPTHNRSNVLAFAIRSVLAQTMPDFELLVVGDGCTDDTAAVVQSFGDERITWFDLPKAAGFGYANRNVALRQARGEFIAYQAHDDLWFPDHLAQMLACFERDGIELAYSLQLAVSVAGSIDPLVFDLNDPLEWDLWHTKHYGGLPISSVVHRRDCLERCGYWNELLRARGDYELWMRIMRREPQPNFAYWTFPTGLRFVADWRRKPETSFRRGWHRWREREHVASPALKLDLAGAACEQEAAWNAMQRAPDRWVPAVRRAVQVDLSRRGAYRLTPSDLLEAFRRYVFRVRRPKLDWAPYRLPTVRATGEADRGTKAR